MWATSERDEPDEAPRSTVKRVPRRPQLTLLEELRMTSDHFSAKAAGIPESYWLEMPKASIPEFVRGWKEFSAELLTERLRAEALQGHKTLELVYDADIIHLHLLDPRTTGTFRACTHFLDKQLIPYTAEWRRPGIERPAYILTIDWSVK